MRYNHSKKLPPIENSNCSYVIGLIFSKDDLLQPKYAFKFSFSWSICKNTDAEDSALAFAVMTIPLRNLNALT